MVQSLVVLWRLSVAVVEQALLQHIQANEREQSNWEQQWHGSSEGEGDKHHVEDVRILVVDEEARTRIEFNVLLLGFQLGAVSIAVGVADALAGLDQVVDGDLDKGHEDVEDHGSQDGVAHADEPPRVEVWVCSEEDLA